MIPSEVLAIMKTKPEPGIELRPFRVPAPQAGEVIVRVGAAGLCGSDLHIYKWSSGYEWMEKLMPLVLGHEFAGEVVAAGENAASLLGKRVVVRHILPCGKCKTCVSGRSYLCQVCRPKALGLRRNGGFAVYAAVPADHCIPMPDDMSYELGALVQPMVLAANSAARAGVTLGDRVVVFGPGPIGLLTLAAARAAGATELVMIGTAGDEERLAIAAKIGATAILNAAERNPVQAVRELFGEDGADVVFEATGAPETVVQGMHMLRPGGTFGVIGIHQKPLVLDLKMFVRADLTMIGMHEGPVSWERALALVHANADTLKHVITHRYPLEEAEAAFEAALHKRGAKIMFIPSGEEDAG